MTRYLVEPPGPPGPSEAGAIPLTALSKETLPAWLEAQAPERAAWVKASGFEAAPGSVCLLPGPEGALAGAVAGVDPKDLLWSFAGLPGRLGKAANAGPPRPFVLDGALDGALDGELEAATATRAALGWALGTYAFDRYRKPKERFASLVWPARAERAAVARTQEGIFLTRDLINTPASDMGPAELAEAAAALAKQHKARLTVTQGEALLKKNYPAIHAVGRASDRAPRLVDLRWGRRGPRVTLVGKGVCFDTGGLDLKPASNMKLMKKDMGGAAHVLGLAHMIMAAKLPLRLRVLVPAVENSVAGNAFRPSDVIGTRKGLTVEVGNTDAEGRLVLADALYEADAEDPALIVDFATLTGAARVALGPSLPAMFCNHEATAAAMLHQAEAEADPLWRLPLHAPYRANLDSKVADLNNIAGDAFAGAIIAALFMAEFVRPATPWVHFDIMGWNTKAAPGRPEGGEAMGLRAVFAAIAALVA